MVLKSGSLNLLEPSGPVQACNWIAFLYMPFNSLLKVSQKEGEEKKEDVSSYWMTLRQGNDTGI
jgi:hypothetical protein